MLTASSRAGTKPGVSRRCTPVVRSRGRGFLGGQVHPPKLAARVCAASAAPLRSCISSDPEKERCCAPKSPAWLHSPLDAGPLPLSPAGPLSRSPLPAERCTADLSQLTAAQPLLRPAIRAAPRLPLLTGSLPCVRLGATPSAQ